MNFRDFLRNHKTAVVVFSLAILVRLGLFFVYFSHNGNDFIATIRGADGYFEISQNLVAGNGYSEETKPPFILNSMRPPGWIYSMALIAKIFNSYVPVYIFQLILSSLIPILGMYLAGRIISRKYEVVAGVLLALEPASVFSSTMVVSEASFTFMFLAFLVFVFRYMDSLRQRDVVFSAIFLGLAILMKPTVQFFPILIPIFLAVFYRKRLPVGFYKHMAYFVLVCCLVLAPWVYRNHKDFGVLGLSAQPAYNLYTILVPTVLSIERGTGFESELKAVVALPGLPGGPGNLSNSGYYTGKAISVLLDHKVALLKSVGVSIVTFFTHDHMLTVLGYGGVTIPNLLEKPALVLLLSDPLKFVQNVFVYANSPGILVLLTRLFWVAITVLFFTGAGLYLYREKLSPFAVLGLLTVIYFVLITSVNGFGMNGRFRIPVNVFLFTFAVYGYTFVKDFVVSKFSNKHA